MKEKTSAQDKLYKAFIYVVLATLAILIIVPVAWVFMASIKENSEFYGNPWSLPAGLHWQNFAEAWTQARMGDYMPVSYTHLDVYKRQVPACRPSARRASRCA